MVKNYTVLLLMVMIGFPLGLTAQEIQIFTVGDFDLKGNVKSCLVSTKYGKEEYEFNEAGLLTKSVTRYNESDYDITYYKYDSGKLLEKRFENYRDKVFDSQTSMANFYTIDSTSSLNITEKIVSYDKEFLEEYEYQYDSLNNLSKIIRRNDAGIDETLVTYEDVKGEKTKRYVMNGILQQSLRTSTKKMKDSVIEKNVLSKKFLKDGQPNVAIEEVFNGGDKRLSKTSFSYDFKSKQFTKDESVVYTYDETGMLLKSESDVEGVREYVYQFDPQGNWIKEIVTPENSYTTRKISYYEMLEEEVKKE